MPFYPAADGDVQPAAVPGVVACRCCPGGISRSHRTRRYPSDMTGPVGRLRAAVAGPGVAGRPRRPPGQLVHARCRRRDPLPDSQRAGVAGAAGGFPARRHRLPVDG